MANFKLVGVSSSTSVWLRVGVRLVVDVELSLDHFEEAGKTVCFPSVFKRSPVELVE